MDRCLHYLHCQLFSVNRMYHSLNKRGLLNCAIGTLIRHNIYLLEQVKQSGNYQHLVQIMKGL